jgi:hypothetical protein
LNRKSLRTFLSVLVLLSFSACDEGIAPRPAEVLESGFFGGLITFHNWPSADSLRDLRLVAFRRFPLAGNIAAEVIAGGAVAYPSGFDSTNHLPFMVDSVRYTIALGTGAWAYVAVAQRFGSNIYADWRAVGQYDLDTILTVPSPVIVQPRDTTYDININVDFDNPPPPPFR